MQKLCRGLVRLRISDANVHGFVPLYVGGQERLDGMLAHGPVGKDVGVLDP